MSYKKSLAFAAFGFGAVLQGCSKDDDEDVEERCKTVTDYDTVKDKDGNAVSDCTVCLDEQFEDSTYAEAKTGLSSDADGKKHLAIMKAWNACGAARPETPAFCTDQDATAFGVTPAPGTAGALALLLGINMEAFNCEVCVGLHDFAGDVPTCVELVQALGACGVGEANLDSYYCPDCANFNDGTDAGAKLCTECLDAQNADGSWSDLPEGEGAEFMAKYGTAYTTCGLTTLPADQCGTAAWDFGTAHTYDVSATNKNTEVQAIVDARSNTDATSNCALSVKYHQATVSLGTVDCFSYKKAIYASLPSDLTPSNDFFCDDTGCLDWNGNNVAADSANCKRCLDGEVDGAWNEPTSDWLNIVSGWGRYDVCGGGPAAWDAPPQCVQTADYSGAFSSTTDLDEDPDEINAYIRKIAQVGGTGNCLECIMARVVLDNAVSCSSLRDATESCAGGQAPDTPVECFSEL